MKCPRCQTENQEGAKFCMTCGFTFTLPEPPNQPNHFSSPGNQINPGNPPYPGNQVNSGNPPYPGNQINPGNPPYPGNQVNPNYSPKPAFSIGDFFSKVFSAMKNFWKKLSLKIRLIAIAALVLLIGVIVAAIFFFAPPRFGDGNFGDNMGKFGISADDLSPVTKEYARLVTFTVEDQGSESREKGWIVVRVGVPDVSDTLIDILYSDGITVEGSTDEEMRDSMRNYIAEKLRDGQYEYKYEVFRLDLERKGFEWKIVPTEELSDFIYQPVYTAYKEALMQRFAQSDPPEKTVPGEEQEEARQDDEDE